MKTKNSVVGFTEVRKADINEFKKDVFEGLTASSKYLKSKYFYDEKGDALFKEIMELPEYYLTRCELNILEENKTKIYKYFKNKQPFQLIDFGAGDGFKTKVLLRHFLEQKADFTYVPVDISINAVESLTRDLEMELPALQMHAIGQEYFSALKSLDTEIPKLILFLGSNIGNFNYLEAIHFFKSIKNMMSSEDILMTGFDLRKKEDVILAAYNDKQGVTKNFNLNLLDRMNRELGANFIKENFMHVPEYDSTSGEARSYLVSTKQHTVTFSHMELAVKFNEGERIHTEVSKKFSFEEIYNLAGACGFSVAENIMDAKGYFTDSLWKI
jgi:L-histidine Nalpha-methyltransferase